jgi:hypothetical protein
MSAILSLVLLGVCVVLVVMNFADIKKTHQKNG